MNEDEVLHDLLLRLDSPVPAVLLLGRRDMVEWPDGCFGQLFELGLLRPAAPAQWVECPACYEGHAEQPIPRGDHFVISCPEATVVRLSREDLEQWQIQVDRLVTLVHEDLGGAGLVRPRIPGRWWTVGEIAFGGCNLIVCRGPRWEQGRSDVANRLSHTLGSDIILTFTETDRADDEPPFIALEHVLHWRDGSLTVDRTRLEKLIQRSHAAQPGSFMFQRRGRGWACAFGGPEFPVTDLVGMRYIARLLRTPGEPVPVEELTDKGLRSVLEPALGDDFRAESSIDLTDRETVRQVRGRLKSVTTQLAAETDEDKIAGLRDEESRLRQYLGATTARGGRGRTKSSGNNPRVNVYKAIGRALAEIREGSPEMERHLDSSVQRGYAPVYSPAEYSPAERIPWIL